MSEIPHPTQSAKSLVRALIVASIIAVIVFVSIVMPAEYNIDPTGIGQRLGLTVLASTSPIDNFAPGNEGATLDVREDETTILVRAKNGLEYKFFLEQYASLTYEWSAGDAVLYFDLHGEPQGDTTGYFESFAAATNSEMKGSIMAPFAGSHGWYWQNNGTEDVTITLKTQGNYEIIGLK